jgi:hypothetical protein
MLKRVLTAVWLSALLLFMAGTAVPPLAHSRTRTGGAAITAMWVELGPDGIAIARAITVDDVCPTITLDGFATPMRLRADSAPPDFAVLVCEMALPPGTGFAAVAGQALPLPVLHPRRIVVIGDTGCRLEDGRRPEYQTCNDPAAWPLAQIARSAAEWRPDLVIHVGDYLYREAPCPQDNAGCAGSPWGDNWPSWDADFFTPAAPLLQAAPWVMVRGNHELCSRAGPGWFRFLDPRPLQPECTDYTEPYAVPFGGLQLLLLDSSNADDYEVKPDQVAVYRAQFDRLSALAGRNAWLLTHRPLYVVGHAGEQEGKETLFFDNENLQEASDNRFPPGLELILSGHIHLFEMLSWDSGRPSQLVVGNSGTLLDPTITTPLTGLDVAGAPVAGGAVSAQFGFLTLEPDPDGWTARTRDPRGFLRLRCDIRGRRVACYQEE